MIEPLQEELNDNEDLLEMLMQGVHKGFTQCYSVGHLTTDGSIWYSLGVAGAQSDWLKATSEMDYDGSQVVSIIPLGTIEHLCTYMGLMPRKEDIQ